MDLVTHTALGYYDTNLPPTEDVWYGSWNTILTALFPPPRLHIYSVATPSY